MGNLQTNLKDFINREGPLEFSYKCNFTVSTSRYTHAPNFEIVTFDIKYESQYISSGTNLLKGTDPSTSLGKLWTLDRICKSIDSFKNVTAFKYFDPSSNVDVVDRVDIYYSIYKPDNPLVIVLKTRDCKKHHYRYRKLSGHTIYYKLPPDHFSYYNLKKVLLQENYKRNKKLKLKISVSENRNVRMVPENREEPHLLGPKGKFKLVSFVPSMDSHGVSWKGPFVLCSSEIFRYQPTDSALRNQIDPFYLNNVADFKFDGVTVYYTNPENVALLLEFVNGDKRWQYVRKNLEGSVWRGYRLICSKDEELVEGLTGILNQLKADHSSRKASIVEELNNKGSISGRIVERSGSKTSSIGSISASRTLSIGEVKDPVKMVRRSIDRTNTKMTSNNTYKEGSNSIVI